MTDFFDDLELRTPEAREQAMREALAAQMQLAATQATRMSDLYGSALSARLSSLEGLTALAVLRKSDLMERQRADPPFGGLTTRDAAGFKYIFQSPGPIYEPGMDTPDWWRFARALHAAGIRAGDVVINCFAYHLTPAGHMLESGARALGATVIPGGVGNSEAQAGAAADLGATAYVGTPDFLRILLDKADEMGRDLAITRALVSGGPLFPSLRSSYQERGISCLQCYGTADVGLIAYETMDADGTPNPGMVIDEGVIVEILRPGTPDRVPDGEVGEVVVTPLNPDYPLLRFATGDLSAVLDGRSPCGRTNTRIKGWMGRADQTTKVKGMFVRPEQIAHVLARHPQATKGRLTVTREDEQDRMTLAVETESPGADLAAALEQTLRDLVKLRGTVLCAAPGSLPNDGKVIDDQREIG